VRVTGTLLRLGLGPADVTGAILLPRRRPWAAPTRRPTAPRRRVTART